MKRIKNRLKMILVEKNIKATLLAEKTGIDHNTLSSLCNNKSWAKRDTLDLIINELGITDMNQLFYVKDEV